MSAIEPLCSAIGINPRNLSRKENFLLEAGLFLEVSNEIKEMFKTQHKEYFCLMNFNKEMENTMIELNFIRLLIQDILESEAYNLSGIACYTQTPEDAIQDLIIGPSDNPILMFPRKLIELHRLIRPNLYKNIIKKITIEEPELA